MKRQVQWLPNCILYSSNSQTETTWGYCHPKSKSILSTVNSWTMQTLEAIKAPDPLQHSWISMYNFWLPQNRVGASHPWIQPTLARKQYFSFAAGNLWLGNCSRECGNTVFTPCIIESADVKPLIGGANYIYWKKLRVKADWLSRSPCCSGVGCISSGIENMTIGTT